MRMLMNNLDEEVAENPRQLVVYGGSGRAARSWDAYHAIVRALRALENDETLLVQSGKPVGVFRTFQHSPRVLIANANLVPHWATRDEFNRLEALQLTMYGQMTAGSWIYIGTQGIVQGTYETFAAAGRKHFNSSLHGRILLTGGLGGMGGAQPLAGTMTGAAVLVVEVDPARIKRRMDSGYLDRMATNLDDAWKLAVTARDHNQPLSIGLVGNCADVLPEMVRRGWIPDVLTDQTSAHDPLNGYIPHGLSLERAAELRELRSAKLHHTLDSIDGRSRSGHVGYATARRRHLRLREQHPHDGFRRRREECLWLSGIHSCVHSADVCRRPRALPMGCLVGKSERHRITDDLVLELFPDDAVLNRWIRLAREKVRFQGLPARICWLGYGERAQFGERINHLVKTGRVEAPVVIGRDHLDCGSVASPYRETEAMKDGSDTIADWPILNALLNTASGASWVSFHHGGGTGIGYSLHAGRKFVADGTDRNDRAPESRAYK